MYTETEISRILERMEHEKQNLGFDFDLTTDDAIHVLERLDNNFCCDDSYTEYDAIVDELIGIEEFFQAHPFE